MYDITCSFPLPSLNAAKAVLQSHPEGVLWEALKGHFRFLEKPEMTF